MIVLFSFEREVRMEKTNKEQNTNALVKTIGKTRYIANIYFKEQGQTFPEKLKRVLKAECK